MDESPGEYSQEITLNNNKNIVILELETITLKKLVGQDCLILKIIKMLFSYHTCTCYCTTA